MRLRCVLQGLGLAHFDLHGSIPDDVEKRSRRLQQFLARGNVVPEDRAGEEERTLAASTAGSNAGTGSEALPKLTSIPRGARLFSEA